MCCQNAVNAISGNQILNFWGYAPKLSRTFGTRTPSKLVNCINNCSSLTFKYSFKNETKDGVSETSSYL